eukprot:GILI01025271.1.p1 GENE.GILI01025271.1~~GILI01025271.1.p1  ORF type:complete len:220 (+),score=75.12 GILI01025271.1:62-721(+)
MARPVLAVDLDEVLGQFVPALVEYHNLKYGSTLQLADFHSYSFHEVWGGTAEESTAKMLEFFASEQFKNLKLLPGAFEGLSTLNQYFDIYLVTSRQHFLEDITREWIGANFPGLFKGLLFGNHWGTTGAKRLKSEMCTDISAVAIIDDSFKYALDCAPHLKKVVLFDWENQYMWSKQEPDSLLPSNVSRVHHWSDVVAQLLELHKEVTGAVNVSATSTS